MSEIEFYPQPPEKYIVQARGHSNEFQNCDELVLAVEKWMHEHKIEYSWQGLMTSYKNNVATYYFDVYIPDEHQKILFLLRWG